MVPCDIHLLPGDLFHFVWWLSGSFWAHGLLFCLRLVYVTYCVCVHTCVHVCVWERQREVFSFILPSVDGKPDCFHIMGIVSNGSTDISLTERFYVFWMYAQKQNCWMIWETNFNVLRSHHGTLHSGCTSFQSHTQHTKIPFSPPSHQHLFSLDFLITDTLKDIS